MQQVTSDNAQCEKEVTQHTNNVHESFPPTPQRCYDFLFYYQSGTNLLAIILGGKNGD